MIYRNHISSIALGAHKPPVQYAIAFVVMLVGCLGSLRAQDGVVFFGDRGRAPYEFTSDTANSLESIQPQFSPLPRDLDQADTDSTATSRESMQGWPVAVSGDTLFVIYRSLGPYLPVERARAIKARIEDVISQPEYRKQSISVREETSWSEIWYGDLMISAVTNEDARDVGGLRQAIAARRAELIASVIEREQKRATPRAVLLGILFTIVASVGVVILWRFVGIASRGLKDRIVGRHALRFSASGGETRSVMEERRADRIIAGIKMVRVILQLSLVYAYVTLVTGFFYTTQGLHISLNRQLEGMYAWTGPAFVRLLPEVFILMLIVAATYISIQLMRYFFVSVSRGTVPWLGSHREWAYPTYRLISAAIVLFSIVLAWPHLPGSQSPVFTGIAIFAGIIVALGSLNTAGSAFAGLVLSYTTPYKVGDRVSIGSSTGEIVDWTLLATRVRLDNNAEVTIPNSVVLSNQIVNYSNVPKGQKLAITVRTMVNADAPRARTEESLLKAAAMTPHVVPDPAPVVMQKSVDLRSATYEVSVRVDDPSVAGEVSSSLLHAIEHSLKGAGIELKGLTQSSDGQLGLHDEEPARFPTPGLKRFWVFRSSKSGVPGIGPSAPAEENVSE